MLAALIRAALIGTALAPTAAAQTVTNGCGERTEWNGRPRITVCRAMGTIDVDGARSEPGWQGAARIDLPYEVYPGNNTNADVATNCYIAFDDENLFLSCDAADPEPSGIRAFFAPRDQLEGQDRIGVVVDPFNDTRRAFEFIVTPLGVQADGVYAQQQGEVDPSWDAIWRSAGRMTESGYSIELAVPFKSLSFPRADTVQTWGFYAWRLRPRSEEVETRSTRLDRRNSCLLCQAALVTGLHSISPSRNVQITPTLTGSRSDVRPNFPAGSLDAGAVRIEPGLDARWGPSPDLSLAATVNPDFSQVETDVAQLDVNNRFTLFYPEKRPFFLEAAEIYTTPLRAVFTRTIADPIFATKLSAKKSATAVGAVLAADRVNNVLLPANQGSSLVSLDGRVTSAIARVTRDVGASSTLGVLYTGREGTGYHNRVLSLDAFLQPLAPVTLRFQFLRSHTDYPDSLAAAQRQAALPFSGNAAYAQANYESRTWRGQAYARALDPGFRADAGFVEQVDVREVNAWAQRQFWGERNGWFTRLNFTGGFWNHWRSDGLLTERVFWGNVLYLGPAMLRIFVDYQRRSEFFEGAIYSLNRYHGEVGFAPSGELRAALSVRAGDAIDLANVRKVAQTRFDASLRLRIGRHIDLTFSDALEGLADGDAAIVTAHLPQLRAVYNLNATTFFRVIAQYQNTDRNPEVYTDTVNANERNLLLQLLFAYEASPQTLLYLGYADNRFGFADTEQSVVPLTLTSRTFFLKLSYAWLP